MGKDLKGKVLGKGLSQRPDGRYNARAMINGVKIDITNFSLPQLKRDFEEAKESLLRKQVNAQNKGMTLDEWFEQWFSVYKEPTLKSSGVAYRRLYVNYFGCRIGTKKLAEITQIDVQIAIADMLAAGRTPKSVKESTGILRQCVEAAMANGMMQINPVIGTQIPTGATAKRRVLTNEEQQEFIEYLESVHSWYEEMYKIMLCTGMRVGEIGGLQWGDIDFQNNCIHVNRTLNCQYEKGVKISKLTSPKTENSVRTIPFFGETKELFENWKKKVEARRAEYGDRWRLNSEEYGDLVFVTSMGSPVARYNAESDMRYVSTQLNAIRKNDAVEKGTIYKEMERIHPHCLRHTFATRCFEKGMTARTVQEIMGHSNYNTTVSYTHCLEDIKQKEAQKVGNFLDTSTQTDKKVAYENLLGII